MQRNFLSRQVFDRGELSSGGTKTPPFANAAQDGAPEKASTQAKASLRQAGLCHMTGSA